MWSRSPGPSGTGCPASGTGADPPGVELPHPISGAAATRAKRHTLTAGKVKVDFIVRLSHREFHRGNGFHVSSCQKTFFRPSPRITTGSSQPPLCESARETNAPLPLRGTVQKKANEEGNPPSADAIRIERARIEIS